MAAGRGEHRARLRDAEHARLAKHVAGDGEPLAGDRRDHLLTNQANVVGPPIAEFGGHLVRAEEGGNERGGLGAREPRDDSQLPQLGLAVEPVARFHLDRRGAVGQQHGQSGACERCQLHVGAGADVPHRLQDPATRRGDRLVVHPQRTTFVIVEARRAEYGVRVAVDKPGVHHPGDLHDLHPPFHVARSRLQVGTPAHGGNTLAVDQDRGIREDFELRHLAAAARPGRAATGDDLTCADQQRPQSPASRIGR